MLNAIVREYVAGASLTELAVHHIDGDRTNNNPNNLALMTRSAHTRLHRREQRLAKGSSC